MKTKGYRKGQFPFGVPCRVCRDRSAQKRFGIYACDGCFEFFQQSIIVSAKYDCIGSESNTRCIVVKTHRRMCLACRLEKCFKVGMKQVVVQIDLGPPSLREDMQMFVRYAPLQEEMAIPASHPSPLRTLVITIPKNFESQQLLKKELPLYFFEPSITPIVCAYSTIQRAAASLAPMDNDFLEKLQPFMKLPPAVQRVMFMNSRVELFILAVAQWLRPFNISHLLRVYEYIANVKGELMPECIKPEVDVFQKVHADILALEVDGIEFGHMRAVALFKTVFDPGSSMPSSSSDGLVLILFAINTMREHAERELYTHIRSNRPNPADRFSRLMDILSALKNVSAFTIGELFFRC